MLEEKPIYSMEVDYVGRRVVMRGELASGVGILCLDPKAGSCMLSTAIT